MTHQSRYFLILVQDFLEFAAIGPNSPATENSKRSCNLGSIYAWRVLYEFPMTWMHSLFFETCYLPTYIYFSLICLYHGLEIHIYIFFFFNRKLQIRGSIVTNQSWRAISVWLEMMARKVSMKLKPNFKKIRKIYLLCGVQVELVLRACLWN